MSFRDIFLFCLFVVLPACTGAADWHVPDAKLRYEVRLIRTPTHSDAGYFAILPDGGILPGPAPVTHVVGADGWTVDSYVLWHNPEGFIGVIFAAPGLSADVRAFVYVSGGDDYKRWHPNSGIMPSSIIAFHSGVTRMPDARALAKFGRVDRDVLFWKHWGRHARLSIGGDLTRQGVYYLLTYVTTHDAGRTWIYPYRIHGQTEVHFDGQLIVPRKRIDKWGGTGDWVTTDYDPQRVDVFQTVPGIEDDPKRRVDDAMWRLGGMMCLTWRTPNMPLEELGGVRSEDQPFPGTSGFEARPVQRREIIHSGTVAVEDAKSREGEPIALISANPTHVFWIDDETPLVLYELDALDSGPPGDVHYEWGFEDGVRAEGKTIRWLLPGFRTHRISLSARAGEGRSESTIPVYAVADVSTSLDDPEHRDAYRNAMLQMLTAYSAMPEKVGGWDVAYWNNFLRTLDFGGGYAVLRDLFQNYSDILRGRLSSEQVEALQELFLSSASAVEPEVALEWAQRFHEEAGNENRQKELAIRKAEIHAHYLDDLEAARRLLAPLARDTDALGQLARVRLGDVALMDGDLNLATRYYANVQQMVRHERGMFTGRYDAFLESAADEPVEAKRSGPVTAADSLRADRQKFLDAARQQREAFLEAARAGRTAAGAQQRSATWKIGALLDASVSENVRKLTDEGYLLEARQALDAWERELPLSKISGDYILLESRFYRESGDPRRAYGMLSAYCDLVDASSYLPEAAKILLKCMLDLEMPVDEIRARGEKLRDRLEFHPVAQELEFIMDHENEEIDFNRLLSIGDFGS